MSRLLLVVFLLLLRFSSAEYENCSTKLSVLEHALYETGDNEHELSRAFFPPRQATSRHINVMYIFLNETGSNDGCRVNYIWAVGGFLLIQPPFIFRFTSLYFSYPVNNNITDMTIHLPSECRMLVSDNNGTCSCINTKTNNLDILTQQIMQYSKYNSPEQVVRDELSTAQAVCEEDLASTYFDVWQVKLYFAVILLFPFIVNMIVGIFVSGHYGEIKVQLNKPSNHPNLAGVVLTMFYVNMVVFGMDLASVYFYLAKTHEYGDYEKVKNRFNLWIVCLTLTFDLLMLLCLVCVLLRWQYSRYCSQQQHQQQLNLWLISCFMYASLFIFSSHIGYILVAWLTEPAKTTSVAILAIGIVVFLFLSFQSLYIMKDIKNPMVFQRCMMALLLCSAFLLPHSLCTKFESGSNKTHRSEQNKNNFNKKAFIIAGALGVFPVGSVALVVSAFFSLPVPTVSLAGYLENIVQIAFVILATLVSYKIFSINDSDLSKFLRSFKNSYEHEEVVCYVPAPFTNLSVTFSAANLTATASDNNMQTVSVPAVNSKITVPVPASGGRTVTFPTIDGELTVTFPTGESTVVVSVTNAKLNITVPSADGERSITVPVADGELTVTHSGPEHNKIVTVPAADAMLVITVPPDNTCHLLPDYCKPKVKLKIKSSTSSVPIANGNLKVTVPIAYTNLGQAADGTYYLKVGRTNAIIIPYRANQRAKDEFVSAGIVAGKAAFKLAT